jgi:hypothetical protein
MNKAVLIASMFIVISTLSGCASTKVAQNKSVEVSGKKLEFGGEFETRGKSLTLKVNGDPVLAGSFPPYTPTLRLNAKYKDMDISADCYFGSILNNAPGIGIGRIVASAVQGGLGKGADKCDMLVGGKVVEALYF